MFCNKCGNQLPDDSKFCNKCGANLDFAAKSSFEEKEAPEETNSFGRKAVEHQASPFLSEDDGYDIPNEPKSSKIKKAIIAVIVCLIAFGIYQALKPSLFDSTNKKTTKERVISEQEKIDQEREKYKREQAKRMEEFSKKAEQERALQSALDFLNAKRDYSEMNLDELDLARKNFRIHKTTLLYEKNIEANKKEKYFKKLTSLRKKEMPQIRKRFAKILSQAIWRENGSASVSGTNNTTINIIHPGFVLSANIQDFNQHYQPMFEMYGFKRATFWMYKGAQSYSSANYEVDDDGKF